MIATPGRAAKNPWLAENEAKWEAGWEGWVKGGGSQRFDLAGPAIRTPAVDSPPRGRLEGPSGWPHLRQQMTGPPDGEVAERLKALPC